jgi:DNA-binding GntR family transcriptional regulator
VQDDETVTVKLQRIPLKDQIKDVLIQRILAGQLKAGDRLKESQIAEEMATSQAPVREAIRCLEVLGYVEHKPHVGARVKSFNREEFIEVYQLREALETYAAIHTVGHRRVNPREVRTQLEGMQSAADRNDISGFGDHDAHFHRIIVEALGNRAMLRILDTLTVQEQVAATLHRTRMSMQEAVDLHFPIVEAIEAGDGQEASLAIAKHYRSIREYL